MDKWIIYALVSMLFAGVVAVIAKLGLAGISGELGLAIRTLFVLVFVLIFAACVVPRAELQAITLRNVAWLSASALATAISWVFYYKAVKEGEVSTVALIDKGSFVVAVVLAWVVLGERITPRVVAGCLLIVAGLLVVARR
jgi:transporter family protein